MKIGGFQCTQEFRKKIGNSHSVFRSSYIVSRILSVIQLKVHISPAYGSRPRSSTTVSEETSAHILCECEALASLRYMHLGSYFLEP